MHAKAEEILAFWLDEVGPEGWYEGGEALDARCRRFEEDWERGVRGDFAQWTVEPRGALALTILLDQFPRNMYRGTARAFATDGKALVIAKFALSKGFDQVMMPLKRRFLYLPFEHSENLNDQRRCVELFEKMKKDDPLGYDYALRHLKVIEKYGRFPHRNKILSRMNTPEEEEYLAQAGAGF